MLQPRVTCFDRMPFQTGFTYKLANLTITAVRAILDRAKTYERRLVLYFIKAMFGGVYEGLQSGIVRVLAHMRV